MIVAACNSDEQLGVGTVRLLRTHDREGGLLEIPALVVAEATRAQWHASRRERGIAQFEPRERVTRRTRFYVIAVD